MTFTQTRTTAGNGLFGMLRNLRDDLADRAARRRKFNQIYSELSIASDRDLADMGIHRSEIGAIAQRAADEL